MFAFRHIASFVSNCLHIFELNLHLSNWVDMMSHKNIRARIIKINVFMLGPLFEAVFQASIEHVHNQMAVFTIGHYSNLTR